MRNMEEKALAFAGEVITCVKRWGVSEDFVLKYIHDMVKLSYEAGHHTGWAKGAEHTQREYQLRLAKRR